MIVRTFLRCLMMYPTKTFGSTGTDVILDKSRTWASHFSLLNGIHWALKEKRLKQ